LNSEITQSKASKLLSTYPGQNWEVLISNLAETQVALRKNTVPHDLVHRYFGTRIQNLDTLQKADVALDETPFWRSLKVFKALFKIDYPYQRTYDTLVSMVGFSLEPVMHTLLTLCPQKVILVFTPESKKFDGEITASDYIKFLIELHGDHYSPIFEVIVLGNTDTAHVFAQVHEKIKEFSAEGNVAIDITGGKKSMDASAFLAASLHKNASIYYVDYEDYNICDGYPVWGTEFLNKLDNPYDVYNVQLLSQAKELFKHHNYQAAYSIFSDIEQKLSSDGLDAGAMLGLDMERLIVKKMKAVSQCYEHWDMFEYDEASSEQYHGLLDLSLVRCLKHPNTNCKIYEFDNQLEYVKTLSLDRYANAERRFQQGRYEDALTRYMQSLEISCKSYAIYTVVNQGLSVSIEDLSDHQNQILGNDTWVQWDIDYAPISAILDWLLCIGKMKWKKSTGIYSLDKLMITDFKKKFCDVFLLNKELSKKKFKEKVTVYTDLIENRNKFIHVSSLSINRVQVEEFRDFIYKMLICLYGIVDLTPYMFSTDFDEKGMLLPLHMDKDKQ
jgi:hypothetical protein